MRKKGRNMKTKEKETKEQEAAVAAAEELLTEAFAEEALATAAEELAPEEAKEEQLTEAAAPAQENTLAAFFAALSPREREVLLGALAHLAESERERERAAAVAEEERAIAEMEETEGFLGIGERKEALRALCLAVPWLGALPLYERLSAAYYIDRGMRYGEVTREDLLEAALSDPALGAALALQTQRANAETGASLPPVGKKRGTTAAPASKKKPPRTLAEASDAAKRFLRFYK